MILKWLTPHWYAPSLADLEVRDLEAAGIRGVILDLDNTLVAWEAAGPTTEVRAWMERLRGAQIRVCIVSNNFRGRSRRIASDLGVPVVAWAVKPIPWAFRRAMTIMGTAPAQTALVGDQLFTDMLGGNLLGVRTILVDPLSMREFPTTRLVRAVERLFRSRVLRNMQKRTDEGRTS